MHRDSSLDVPALFPASGTADRHPLGSAGSRSAQFPGFTATMRCSEPRPPFPPAFVSFARRLPPLRLFSFPCGPTPATGPGAVEWQRPPLGDGDGRVSQVPGEP